jgi:hypothetical protein
VSHTFFGPWHIQRTEPLVEGDWDRYRLTVTGSAGSDGDYPAGANFSLHVDGGTWTLGGAFRAGSDWVEMDVFKPHTAFDRAAGLVVTLTFLGRLGRTVALTARCVSEDPAVNPDPQGDPYDFSLPG